MDLPFDVSISIMISNESNYKILISLKNENSIIKKWEQMSILPK